MTITGTPLNIKFQLQTLMVSIRKWVGIKVSREGNKQCYLCGNECECKSCVVGSVQHNIAAASKADFLTELQEKLQ